MKPCCIRLSLLAAAGACSLPDDPRRDLAGAALLYDDTIVTRSARTVDFNGQALLPRYVYTEKDRAGERVVEQAVVLTATFGLREDTTVQVSVPYVSKRRERPGQTQRADGLGDVPVVVKHRFFQETGAAETTEAAALLGLELPAGRTDASDGGVRLPQPLQPGSGSVDAVLGVAFTRIDGRFLLNADAIARLNSEADDYRFGNSYFADVGGQFRLYPRRYESFDQTTVLLIAELNSVYEERHASGGATVFDSGGLKVFATPGVQVIAGESLLIETAVQLPLIMELHGSQPEESFRWIFGLRWRF